MNINLTVQCDECGEPTNCRFGMSNRRDQVVGFSCADCGNGITISVKGTSGRFKFNGAKQIEGDHLFDEKTNFVDLHLDFPVLFEKYVIGMTPYMRAVERCSHEEMNAHSARLDEINNFYRKYEHFKTILKLYRGGKNQQTIKSIDRRFKIRTKSDNIQDINAAVYTLIHKIMHPYERIGSSQDIVEKYNQTLSKIAKDYGQELSQFVDEIADSGFLKNIQHDCLQIYPRILEAELPLRSVLFLDFDMAYKNGNTPMRISIDTFDKYKDLYKDIAEIISRQLVLVAGINNLLKRGNHNTFKPGIGLAQSGRDHTPQSLDKFADIDFGRKLDFIDDCWFQFSDDAADNQLRNAIAHFKTDYDEITQKITYFPRREGMKEDRSEELYFLEFLHRLLISYREMHRLHHLIKALFYYRYLIQKKN